MNENLNLLEILKDCPKGTKLYSTIYGEVELDNVNSEHIYPVKFVTSDAQKGIVTAQGLVFSDFDGECTLFPSRDERDWSKFKPNKLKFDPKTLKPFDKVLARNEKNEYWWCTFFSHKRNSCSRKYVTTESVYEYCIPYNYDTKHLVGTADEAPEFYRYWEE